MEMGGSEHNKSGAGEESYAALCAGCKGNEASQIIMLYCVKLGL